MVSKKSIKTASINLRSFLHDNPNAGFKKSSKALGKFAQETSEVRVSIGTLPSVFLPTPKYISDRIDKQFKRK